jgi:hypothetical protein
VWSEQAKLPVAGGHEADDLGINVDASKERIIVGAWDYTSTTPVNVDGATFVCVRSKGGLWIHTDTLFSRDGKNTNVSQRAACSTFADSPYARDRPTPKS